jgi:hypothetical protein
LDEAVFPSGAIQEIVEGEEADVGDGGTKVLADGMNFDFAEIGEARACGAGHEEGEDADIEGRLAEEVNLDGVAGAALELLGEGGRGGVAGTLQRIAIFVGVGF